MTHENFCYWLQGFIELDQLKDDESPDWRQWSIIKEHLQLCFNKVTGVPPKKDEKDIREWAKKLNEVSHCVSSTIDQSKVFTTCSNGPFVEDKDIDGFKKVYFPLGWETIVRKDDHSYITRNIYDQMSEADKANCVVSHHASC